jgi:hypothetical protein
MPALGPGGGIGAGTSTHTWAKVELAKQQQLHKATRRLIDFILISKLRDFFEL